MKNIALIIAAGIGSRTGNHIPKQFLTVNDKPVVIYTLERFQKSPVIDGIGIVYLDGWKTPLETSALQFGISKLKWYIPGGDTAQESIFNGLNGLQEYMDGDDIIIIHDGVRPMIDDDIIESSIETCLAYGNGVTTLPITEQIFRANSETTTNEYIPRESLRMLQTPQAYKYCELLEAYKKGFETNIGIQGSSYANTLFSQMGHTLYFSKGSTKNIKITTKDDIAIFKAMIKEENL